MKDNNEKFWNKMSRFYKMFQENGNKKLYLDIANKIQPFIENKSVLELACGSGQISVHLASLASSYIASDYSSKMVSEAKKRHIENISFECIDATSIPYKDNLFDVVIIANALHIMPSPSDALKEIKRVLKSDGLLIAPTFIYDTKKKSVKLWVSKRFGFHTYHKWKSNELKEFISQNGYKIIKNDKINGKPLDVSFIIAKKNKLTNEK